MKIDILNIAGDKVSSYDLPKEIFEVKTHEGLIHQALVLQLANRRQGSAKTKTRGEVSGGGKKPWKQKGTGRARTGSNRNPLWRGGGVIFGPTGEQNYTKDMPKKQRRKALFSLLSKKVQENNVFGLEELVLKEPKTRIVLDIIKSLPVKRNALLVIPENDALVQRACSNISSLKVIQASYLNVFDLLKYETVIFLKSALKKTESVWLEAAKEIWKDTDKIMISKKGDIKKTQEVKAVKEVKEVKKVTLKKEKAVEVKKDTKVTEAKSSEQKTLKKALVKKPTKVVAKSATKKTTTVKKVTTKKLKS